MSTQQQKALTPKAKTDNFMVEVKARAQSFARLLPKGMDAEWFLGEVRVAVARAPGLLDCEPVSVFDALTTCAQLGLSPSGRLGSAYLLPFRDNRNSTSRCQLVVGYKGYVDLAYRSGEVVGFGAQVVHEGEPFKVNEGFGVTIEEHSRDVEKPGPLRAVYAWAEMRGGYVVKVLMWRREVLAIKARSRGGSNGPWATDEAEMWKKTALRRLLKLLPLSPQKAQALHRAQEAEDAEYEDAAPLDLDVAAAPPTTGTAALKNRLRASGGERVEETLDRRKVLTPEAIAEGRERWEEQHGAHPGEDTREPLPASHPDMRLPGEEG